MRLCACYAHIHQGPRCVQSMLPPCCAWGVGTQVAATAFMAQVALNSKDRRDATEKQSEQRHRGKTGQDLLSKEQKVHHVSHEYELKRG